MEIRPLTIEERKYTYDQSHQISGQTGNIGYLRGDFGPNGQEFYCGWFDKDKTLKTPEFSAELDKVINELREKGLLAGRNEMRSFVKEYPDSTFAEGFNTFYGFRVDTDAHAYLFRCNPLVGDYNFYCYCYEKRWLDHHIERASQDISFINPNYKELFRIQDGDYITVTAKDGRKTEYKCRFIDEAHTEIGNNLYHNCEFAELMERIGATCQPTEPPLPRECLSTLPSTGELIQIDRYQKGYRPRSVQRTPEENRALADLVNSHKGVTKAQEAAMLAGSMFGWDCPAAQPKNHDENGALIKQKKNRDMER